MLRIGSGKPGIYEAHGDPHHPMYPPLYVASNWFWMGLSQWMEVNDFQTFDVEALSDPSNYIRHECAKRELEHLMKKSLGQLWQMNVVHKDLNQYRRIVVALGEPSLVRWTWVDCYVKQPFYEAVAYVRNKIAGWS